jgi:hypothetical protein
MHKLLKSSSLLGAVLVCGCQQSWFEHHETAPFVTGVFSAPIGDSSAFVVDGALLVPQLGMLSSAFNQPSAVLYVFGDSGISVQLVTAEIVGEQSGVRHRVSLDTIVRIEQSVPGGGVFQGATVFFREAGALVKRLEGDTTAVLLITVRPAGDSTDRAMRFNLRRKVIREFPWPT